MSETTSILPKEAKKAAEHIDPSVLILYGPPKVGKTTVLEQLPGALIIDTEMGSRHISGLVAEIGNLTEFSQIYREVKALKYNHYPFIALDTLDNLVNWIEADVCRLNNVSSVADMPFGAGYDAVRTRTITTIRRFREVTSRLVLIGHRKRTLIGEKSVEVKVDMLDLTGKLKNMLMAEADAIGYVHRSPADSTKLMVSFVASEDLEAGSRSKHLAGKVIEFDWSKIYVTQETLNKKV